MRLFMSYTRADKVTVRHLVDGLRVLGHEVWFDEELSGGQVWWSAILERIRNSDAFVFGVSPAALDSQACVYERRYATELGKPILPVMLERLTIELLPPDLAPIQLVDYTTSQQEAAFILARAVFGLPPAASLPDPLPTEPPVPTSYLSDLSGRVRAETLSLDEQLALIARLKAALQRTGERMAAIDLIQKLQQRDDLFFATAKEILALGPLMDSLPEHEGSMPAATADSSELQPVEPSEDNATKHDLSDSDNRKWGVEVVRKDEKHRTFEMTRRSAHSIVYETVDTKNPNFERLTVDDQVVGETTPWSGWKSEWDFTIVDDSDVVSVTLIVKRTVTGRIRFCTLVVENREIYSG